MKMSRSIFLALMVSFAVHAFLAVGLAAYLEYVPAPDVAVTLDVSSVQLSFAEKVDEMAIVSSALPTPSVKPPRPKFVEQPPERKIEKILAPAPLATRLPEPREESERIKPMPAPAVAQSQARIDAPPIPRRTIRPDYPKGARRRGEQGEVMVEIHVDTEGGVSAAKVIRGSGFAELDVAAVRAVKKAKFCPAKSGRKSIASVARMKLDFKLK